MKHISFALLFVGISLFADAQTSNIHESNWCNHPSRAAFGKLTEIKTSGNWFKVYSVDKNVIAIAEPYNFEEVISYLILGKSRALLFDTGMGLDSISPLIKQLTRLPVIVINSHTHYDHTGGNYEFKNILAMNTTFTKKHAKDGWSHESVDHEVTIDALCLQELPSIDTAHYYIRPFRISRFVKDGDEIDLDGKKITIIAVPGHTPDAIALLDKTDGFLWTGDTFYEGPIYLFSEGTDLSAYERSVAALAALAPQLKKIFPSHNNPVCWPERLIELKNDFSKVKNGQSKGEDRGNNTQSFQFTDFGFLIGNDFLKKFRSQ